MEIIRRELEKGASIGALELSGAKSKPNTMNYSNICKRVEKGRILFRTMEWINNDLLSLDVVKKMQVITEKANKQKLIIFEQMIKPAEIREFLSLHLSPYCNSDDPLVRIVKSHEREPEPVKIPDDPKIRMIIDMFSGVPYVEKYAIVIFLDVGAWNPVSVVDSDWEKIYQESVKRREELNQRIVL